MSALSYDPDKPGVVWDEETGLLPCFSTPCTTILDRVGYKNVSGLVFSTTCRHCGNFGGFANPLTLVRTCKDCSNLLPGSWTIVKSKAKEAFLLSDKDLSVLPKAAVSPGIGPTRAASTFFLYNDVKQASFQKFGDASGLEAEIMKRLVKATAKYNRDSVNNPTKKKPKIFHLSTRPADDPESLISAYASSFPIGFVTINKEGPTCRPTLSLETCISCTNDGCNLTMPRDQLHTHCAFEHDVIHTPSSGHNHNISDILCETPNDLVPLEILEFPSELVAQLSSADMEYSLADEGSGHIKTLRITFSEDIKIMLMEFVIDGHFPFTEIEYSGITISGKCKSCRHHKVVLNCISGIWGDDDEPDLNKEVLEELMGSLSLNETSHVQFVAGLISMVYNRTGLGDSPLFKLPIRREAFVYLQDKIGEDGTNESD